MLFRTRCSTSRCTEAWKGGLVGSRSRARLRSRLAATKGTVEERDAFSQSPFRQWLERQGIAWGNKKNRRSEPSVYISTFREGETEGIRGLAAAKSCSKDEVILSLSSSCCFPPKPTNQPTQPRTPHWGCTFSLALLQERARGEEGKYWSYIESLPRHVVIPSEFSWETLEGVEYLPAYDRISTYQYLVSHWYEQWKDLLPEKTTLEDWGWANAICHSRTFRTESGRWMLPLLDLINHSFPSQNVDWKVDGDSINLVALDNIEEHEQLYLSYGEKGSDDYFVFYGFVPDANPFEDAVLFESIEDAISWYIENFADGIAESTKNSAVEDAFRMAKSVASPTNDSDDVERLKATLAGEVDVRMMEAFESLHASTQGPCAVECMYTRCQELLASFSTTLDADLEFLKHPQLGEDARLVTQYRASKKHLLTGLQQLFAQALYDELEQEL